MDKIGKNGKFTIYLLTFFIAISAFYIGWILFSKNKENEKSLLAKPDKIDENFIDYNYEEYNKIQKEMEEFSFESFEKLIKSDSNIIYSPFSYQSAMGLLCASSGEESKKIIEKGLRLSSFEAFERNYKVIVANLKRGGKSVVFNSIWLDKDIKPNTETIKKSADNFYSHFYKADFSKKSTYEKMSKLVEENTKGKLKFDEKDTEPNKDTAVIFLNTRTEKGEVDYGEDFFGKACNLTVSGQLEGEIFALAFRNIYIFGPTFRAENSNTARHASEFWMIEPEMAFADLRDNMDVAEAMVKYIIKYVLEHAPEEMEFFDKFVDKGLLNRLQHIVDSDFERVTYTKAVETLQNCGEKFQYPVEWGIDLQTEHERYLTEKVFKKPIFVTDYPKDIKAFYMRLNDDGKTVAACDMLVPGVGEIVGGSQREERIDVLRSRMKELDLEEKDYWWYMQLRKYGGVKHAGYGLGFERMIMYITGMSNIRDVLPFPRTPKSAEF